MYIGENVIPLTVGGDWWRETSLPDDYKFPEWISEVKYVDGKDFNEGAKMNELLKKYHKIYMSAEVADAYELGAMDEDGYLTPDGIELLCEVFNDNADMRKIFFDVIKEILTGKNSEGKKNAKRK